MIAVNLGNKVIEGKSLQFTMRIKQEEPHHYEINIPAPSGYDHTEYSQSKYFKKSKRIIFRAYLSTVSVTDTSRSAKEWIDYYKKANKLAKLNGTKFVVLHAYYLTHKNVSEKYWPVNLTSSEERAFSGKKPYILPNS